MTIDSPYTREMLEEALAACASEPVHIPGAIQAFGGLLCLDAGMRYVTQASANIETIFGLPLRACLGAPAEQVLGQRLLLRLKRGLRKHAVLPGFTINRRLHGQQQRMHISAYHSETQLVLEIEPLHSSNRYRWLALVNTWLEKLGNTSSEIEVCERLVEAVRSISGHDRCLLYVFDEDYNGKVLAESRNERLPLMLGHHFPASDIPPQVRALYSRNRIRMIADSDGEAVPLVPKLVPETGQALDMSEGSLRAASPVHCQYMRNMGTRASLSIAIFDEERLWGLLACHHAEPRNLSPSIRDSAATLVQMGSQRLFLMQAQQRARYRRQVHQKRVLLARGVQQGSSPKSLLRSHAGDWLELMRAQGLALLYLDELIMLGLTPEREEVLALSRWLQKQSPELEAWQTDSLADSGFEFSVDEAAYKDYCGLLAMPLMIDMSTRGWLFFFRPERIRSISWAGQPEKDVRTGKDGQLRLSPRQSFAAWQQEVSGRSEDWLERELSTIRDLGDDLALIISAHRVSLLNEELQRERVALDAANRHLRELAYTDSLTGVMNRYRIEHLLQMALANAARYQHIFSLTLFDIDHFKRINDTFGHDEGDRILQSMVDVVKACLREGDQLGRWGGEEFMILLPATPLQGAKVFADRVRAAVAENDFGLAEALTISLGVAQWETGDSLKSLLVRADQAMYKAKRSGRNQVCS